MALDRLTRSAGAEWRKDSASQSQIARIKVGDIPILLAKPQTYMNNSGITVSALMQRHKIPPPKVIVIVDDMALEVGGLRVRSKGSAGGHNGLKSIIGNIGQEFSRIRLGIGHPGIGEDIVEYVLDKFPSADWERLAQSLDRVGEVLETMILQGIEMAMNKFNRKNEIG